MCEPSPLTNPELPVHVWITGQITECRHLLNNYPDLYWATVFAHFAPVREQPNPWIAVQCLRDPAGPGTPMAAVVPTLLDHHGLVPVRDSHQGEPFHPDYRHLPRTRVNALYETFHQNLDFYEAFILQNQQNPVEYEAYEQPMPFDAGIGALYLRINFFEMPAVRPRTGVTSWCTLQEECLWIESDRFAQWLHHRLHIEQNEDLDYAGLFDGRIVQRFRLAWVMTILPQLCRVISQMKGMAYDLVKGIEVAIDQKIADHGLMVANREIRLHYMATMLLLLYRSNTFVQRVGQLAEAVGLDRDLIDYLNLIRVSNPAWNADWPDAARMATQMRIDDQAIIFNQAYRGQHWTLLRLISVLPPLAQMTTGQFMELFVDSMVEHVGHPIQHQERLDQLVVVEDSDRFQREVQHNEGVGNQVQQLDPLIVRAKIVWLLFMMPYLEQVGPEEFRLNPRGDGAAAARRRGGRRLGGQGYGRGGQGQMPPNPPQYLNPGNFGPNYGNQWDNTETDNQVRASGAMDGEIDCSETNKLQDELDDPIEKSFNDLNGSLSQLHLSTTD